ncbi:MAG: hypothetical protein UW29_C0004G0028 [Candidatus Collierbacteria bacterium GW2011_GWC2_44_13]|nr:MAG: hypothetical protein UW29_C0004G0028 [Candidatus Collierbacteria bacterium GW2011_GWC2_44_13]
MPTTEEVLHGLEAFKKHVTDYENSFRKRNKLPKNFDYRPYRWCSRDIVFSLLVVKHNRKGNFLEVDVCLIANPPQYVENSGAKVALGFLLSESYKCGGSMEIVFASNVEGGRVPAYICDLAIEMGVKLKHVFEGHITPFEARQLYLGLAGFSQTAKEKIMKMAVDKLISPERVCFLIMGGVWSLSEAESIILGSRHPERLLQSASDPEDRHLYLNDLRVAGSAILGGVLDRKLLRTELFEGGQIVESEDEESPLAIDFDSVYFAKIYHADTELMIPWIDENKMLSAGQRMVVLVRARSDGEIQKYFLNDLGSLKKLIAKYRKDATTMVFYLVPRDFEDVSLAFQTQIISQLKKEGVYLMLAPDSMTSLDKEAIRRLETGRRTRQ